MDNWAFLIEERFRALLGGTLRGVVLRLRNLAHWVERHRSSRRRQHDCARVSVPSAGGIEACSRMAGALWPSSSSTCHQYAGLKLSVTTCGDFGAEGVSHGMLGGHEQ